MLDRAYRLSSCWSYFSEKCDRLTAGFSRLKYPQHFINSTINSYIASKVAGVPQPAPARKENPTVRKVHEIKTPIFNQQRVIYKFQCHLHVRFNLWRLYFQYSGTFTNAWRKTDNFLPLTNTSFQ